jgi:hypothetical protein
MSNWLLRRALPFAIVLLAACDGGIPTEPPSPLPRSIISGDYDFAASGGSVSKAWDTYSIRLEGTIRLYQDPSMPSRISGSFSRLHDEIDGFHNPHEFEGVITGSIDSQGRLILELTTSSGEFTWVGRGLVVDSNISGQWTSSHPAAGGFTAQLVH